MKKLFAIATLIVLGCFSSLAQEDSSKKEVSQWYEGGDWLNGLTAMVPHNSINQQELYRQFHANNVWWNKALNFLKTNDLSRLENGSYVIEEGNVMAYVSEGLTKEIEEINWETHKNFNDLQYIIKGKAKMGMAAINDSGVKVKKPYDSKRDVKNYEVSDAKYHVAEPGTFFIFTPKDIHRPAFKMPGYDSVKKILIKVRVP